MTSSQSDTTRTAIARLRGKPARGIFINTAEAKCSIFESGSMVFSCIRESNAYTLDYFSLDTIDVSHFSKTGKLVSKVQAGGIDAENVDFWVFNWHPFTMAPHLDSGMIAALPGLKFTIVLELAAGDPLKMVPRGVFDGYIALDPTAPATNAIFPFPRPLQSDARAGRSSGRQVPVIGSFGYGTPGKGFELLIEAVNRAFDAAVVRVNVPRGTFVSTDEIHNRDYAQHIANVCKKIAKPGIEVRFTNDFMTAETLIDWCADNDLNCFMYTRCQPGLSATTDQAITSGKPLLTLSNDTFRHIHRYIPPYSVVGLREAMETTAPAVARLQHDWSRAAFNSTFHAMLASFGLVSIEYANYQASIAPATEPYSILVASPRYTNDISNYSRRLGDSLGRSGAFQLVHADCSNLAELASCIDELSPDALILVNFAHDRNDELRHVIKKVPGPKILITDSASQSSSFRPDGISVLARKPIVPFFTAHIALRTTPRIWLVGFSVSNSNLEEVVAKIAAEKRNTRVVVEVPDEVSINVEARLQKLRDAHGNAGLELSASRLPSRGEEIISSIAPDSLIAFFHDPTRNEYLENVSSLAMATERAVVFTRSSPFPQYSENATFIEDSSFPDLIELGLGAHVGLLHDFGEWQTSANIVQILNAQFARSSGPRSVNVAPKRSTTVESILALREEAFVRAAYRAILGRMPDAEGLSNYLGLLRRGAKRSGILAALRLSPEGKRYGAEFPGLRGIVVRHQTFRLLPFGMRLLYGPQVGRARTYVDNATAAGILALSADEFIDAAYTHVLGRPPDSGGRQNYLNLLLQGATKSSILAALRLSSEGQQRGAQFPGLYGVVVRQRLVTMRFVGWFFRLIGTSSEPRPNGRTLRVLENRLYRLESQQRNLLTEVASQNSAAISTTPVASAPVIGDAVPITVASPTVLRSVAVNLGRRSIFLLVAVDGGSLNRCSNFVHKLSSYWLDAWGALRFIVWDGIAKQFRLATRAELTTLGIRLGPTYTASADVVDGARQVIVEHSSCGPDDWLFVPDVLSNSENVPDLVEMNAILEARRLRLHCGFVFHGAERLRVSNYAGPAAQAQEQYMQALLLADLNVAPSKMAAAELLAFFTHHQLADFGPLIRKLPFPSEIGRNDEIAWTSYMRRLHALLDESSDSTHNLTSIFLLHAPQSDDQNRFNQHLATSFFSRGISVIPVVWHASSKRLIEAHPARQIVGAQLPWSPFVEPGASLSPNWLFLPHGVQFEGIEDLCDFGRRKGFRIASTLHAEAPTGQDETGGNRNSQFESLTRLDKVFAASEARFNQFYTFLLSVRSKLTCAEDRFKTIRLPYELIGIPRRSLAKPARQERVELLAWIGCRALAFDDVVFEAMRQAIHSKQSTISATFVVVQCETGCKHLENIRQRIETVPGARLENGRDNAMVEQLLASADLALIECNLPRAAELLVQHQWRRIPCLVDKNLVQSGHYRDAGLISIDMSDRDGLAAAILDATRPEVLRSLWKELFSLQERSWASYAGEIVRELATDRATDSLRMLTSGDGDDVYRSFVNLRPRPVLSLCISTYNRAGWLALSLRNIFSQIPEVRSDLEVLVVDNTSTDKTPEVAQPYLHRSDFSFVRNPRNVGMLGNLSVTAQFARGKYIWILGDDDLTRPGTIEHVLRLLKERPQLELIYLNYGYSSESNPENAADLTSFLANFNILEPSGSDQEGPVNLLAAKSENFYAAIYSHVYRRDHAIRSYCQDTSGRIFSTMKACIPTSYYVLNYMPDRPGYWVGEPSLVVNSNVSWAKYGALLDLEQLPRAWDLAERTGSVPIEVDRRRANRLWLVELMWKEIFENDVAGNSAYFSASRVLMRLKHLPEFENYVDRLRAIYEKAHNEGNPAAALPPSNLFSAFPVNSRTH